jgi:hypothetical protein
VRAFDFRRAAPGEVPALEAEGYRVTGGHYYSGGGSVLLVREARELPSLGDDRAAGDEVGEVWA